MIDQLMRADRTSQLKLEESHDASRCIFDLNIAEPFAANVVVVLLGDRLRSATM